MLGKSPLLILSLLLLVGCAKPKSASTGLVISVGALVGVSFRGGALVQAKDELTGETQLFELTEPYNVTLPFGVWSLYLVGFEGTSQWTGPHACGGIEKFDFLQSEQTVQIKADSATCNSEPYATIKNLRASSSWDVGVWDTSKWE